MPKIQLNDLFKSVIVIKTRLGVVTRGRGCKKNDTIQFSRPITKVTHPNSPLGTGVHWTRVTASHSVAFVAVGYHYRHTPTIQTLTSPSNTFFQYLFFHYNPMFSSTQAQKIFNYYIFFAPEKFAIKVLLELQAETKTGHAILKMRFEN